MKSFEAWVSELAGDELEDDYPSSPDWDKFKHNLSNGHPTGLSLEDAVDDEDEDDDCSEVFGDEPLNWNEFRSVVPEWKSELEGKILIGWDDEQSLTEISKLPMIEQYRQQIAEKCLLEEHTVMSLLLNYDSSQHMADAWSKSGLVWEDFITSHFKE